MTANTADEPAELREWERYDSRRRLLRFFGLLLAAVVLIASWRALDVRYQFLASAPREAQDLVSRMFPPDMAYSFEIVRPLIETVNIAILGTILAVLLAAPVAYIGAENTAPNRASYALGKFIISASRSVNILIWALIFVVVFGPGVLAGVLATAVRSIGFLAKLLAESIEEIEYGQIEAVRAAGAGGLATLIYGIVPQIKPAFVGLVTYRWDINVRAATILGFVGAGGIGVELTQSINAFRWDAVAMILLAILVVVLFSEAFSAYVRRKVS